MGRRDSGTGSVYQRKDGLYVAQLKGSYRYAKTEREARRKLLEMMQTKEEATPKNIPVGKVLDDYLAAATPNLKARTVKRYSEAIQVHLRPAFGKTKLHKLTALQVEETYARKLRDGLSASTIQLINAVLSSALKRAVRLKLVQTNVCKDVLTPRREREEAEIFTLGEVQALLLAASQDRLEALWTLALQTGAREGEILGLQVSDYNAQQGTLRIARTIYNGAVSTPKSKRGRRTITLPKQAQRALEAHLEANKPARYIFTTSTGKPLSSSHFIRNYWRPLVERAGVEYRCFHTCRHTVASTLLGKGLPIPAIARYLGHKEQMLLSTYSHLMPDQMDAVAAAMSDALG